MIENINLHYQYPQYSMDNSETKKCHWVYRQALKFINILKCHQEP